METQRNKFVKVFQNNKKNQVENIDPLTHSLPPIQIQLSQHVAQILQKVRDTIVCVSAIGFNSQFFSLVRKILLLDTFQQQNIQRKHINNFNELYLSTKIQIVPIESIQWIYGELKLRKYDKEQKLSPIYIGNHQLFEQRSEVSQLATFLGSSVIFVQIECSSSSEQIINLLKKISSKIDELQGSFPKIYFMFNSENRVQIQFQQLLVANNLRYSFQTIIAGDWSENWDEQFRLINLGKTIMEKLRPKIIEKVSINARFLTYLWSIIAIQEDKSAINAFQTANQTLIQQQSQQALSHYVSRIQEITEGHGLLSSQFFKNVQTKVRTDIMRQVTERTGALSQRDCIMKTQRRLLQVREEMQSRNQKAVLEWGKQILKQSWAAIDKKIGKQIKSISALRQQVSIFVQFFRKKSENYICIDLLVLLLDFLAPKILQLSQIVMNNVVVPLQEQQVTSQTQLISFSTEIKDLRKKVGKQQGEISRKMMDLKQKNFQLEATLKMTQKSLQLSRQQFQKLKQMFQQKIIQLREQHQILLKAKQQQIENMFQKSEINFKKASLLENQLNKQKLLHYQTKKFYQQSIQNLKTKEAELRQQLQQFSLSASREIDQMKSSSTKELDNFLFANSQLSQKIATLQQQLSIKEQIQQKSKLQLLKLREEAKGKEMLLFKINQLQIKHKIMEQFQLQCVSLRAKIKKNQQDLKKMSRQKQQKIQQWREQQTKSLLILQKYDYLAKQLDQERIKSYEIANKLQLASNQKQLLEQQLQKGKKTVKIDFSCQIQDNSVKQKLKIAIQMIKQIENEYSKLKAESQSHYKRRY